MEPCPHASHQVGQVRAAAYEGSAAGAEWCGFDTRRGINERGGHVCTSDQTGQALRSRVRPLLRDHHLVADELIRKDVQFKGFRQVWSERPDGVFHGEYTVYWDSGPVLCLCGQYVDGRQEGIWTSWDRDGKVLEQGRFVHDEAVQVWNRPPWESAMDQQAPSSGAS